MPVVLERTRADWLRVIGFGIPSQVGGRNEYFIADAFRGKLAALDQIVKRANGDRQGDGCQFT